MIPYKQGVYKIENQENGKVYVGSTNNLNLRRNNHFSDLRHDHASNHHLQNAWNKYGEDSFEFKVVEKVEGDYEKLREREKYWINELNSTEREQGYNFYSDPTVNEGLPRSEETREKISKAKKGESINYTMTEEERAWRAKRCKEFRPGDHKTEEQERKRLENLREAIQGTNISEEHKEAISKANRGASNGQAKLTAEDVKLIRFLRSNTDMTQKEVADKFDISRSYVGDIENEKRWSHIGIEKEEISELEKKVSFG